MVSVIERTGFEVDCIDVFCGFGGSSQGMHRAGATVIGAANHNVINLECHQTNFPDVDHWLADLVDEANPEIIDSKGKKVPGRYIDPADLPAARFAWFSPACTHHSQANAKKIYKSGLTAAMLDDPDYDDQAYVNSERSRVTMSCVLRYAYSRKPDCIAVENVVEVTKWGPDRDGSTFEWWCRELEKAGYNLQHLYLNSMFFPPCPQSRDRYYCVATRKGLTKPDLDYRPPAYCTSQRCGGKMVDARQVFKRPTKAWPMQRWGKYKSQYDYRCPDCGEVVHPASWMALSAIDLTNLGPTIGERREAGNPMAANTLERTRRAWAKYMNAPPVLLDRELAAAVVHTAHASKAASDVNRSSSAAEPLATLSQKNDQALAAIPMLVKENGSMAEAGYRGHHLGAQLGAVTVHPAQRIAFAPTEVQAEIASGAERALALVVPNRTHNQPKHAADPLAPVMTSATQAVVVTAAGNTAERPGQTRARHSTEPLFTQSSTGEFATAFSPVLRGGDHDQQVHLGEQFPTVATGGGKGGGDIPIAVVPLFSKINGGPGDTAWHELTDPLNTITGRDTTGLVLLPWIDHWRSDPSLLTEQIATLTTKLRQSLATAPPFEGEITDEMLDQVHFRMLEPDPELRRAMAFHDDYILIGNKGQMTAGLGNAVTPPVSEWITMQCLLTFGDGATNAAA